MNTIFSLGMANLRNCCVNVLRRGKGFRRHAIIVYGVNLSGLRSQAGDDVLRSGFSSPGESLPDGENDELSRSAMLSIVLSMLLIHLATATDWPQFHGPTGDGVSSDTKAPWEWNETKNVKRTIRGDWYIYPGTRRTLEKSVAGPVGRVGGCSYPICPGLGKKCTSPLFASRSILGVSGGCCSATPLGCTCRMRSAGTSGSAGMPFSRTAAPRA